MERLRAKSGLASLGYDLRRCYTDADLRLFANFPALFPEARPHAGADFIGPIAWSPDANGNIDFLSGDQPLVYITMGSSGDLRILGQIIPIVEGLGSRIVVTTAGRPLQIKPQNPNTKIFDFLPGAAVCQQASLVVCNGGSPTTNQALRCGVPVLGIAHNMDQFLNMRTIENYGAGLLVRSDHTNTSSLRKTVQTLMTSPQFTERARALAQSLPEELPGLENFITRLLGLCAPITQNDATKMPIAST
jgi:UDP:flavonoid glycosyltransferase YjiC (YdhE family)